MIEIHPNTVPQQLFVAEAKFKSPFNPEFNVDPRIATRHAIKYGDIVSVHTNPLWGGSYEALAYVRDRTDKPILAKGFHDTIVEVKRAFDHGANYVLTVGWWPEDPRCWHECENLEEVRLTQAPYAVWNARNPRTGEFRKESFHLARNLRKGWLCQASGIKKPTDVDTEANAYIVGTNLETFINPTTQP